jgi:SulP family sulfate permease
VLVIVLLAPFAAAIPLAALAAILFTVAWNMSDVPHFLRLARRAPLADRVLLLVTFALTVFVDLVVAVNVGVVIAALLFMRRMSESVQVHEQVFDGTHGTPAEPPEPAVTLPQSVLVYRLDGPFFFGAAEKLERTLERVPLGVGTIVLRLGRVPFMDATGQQALREVIDRFRKRGVRVLLCGLHEELRASLAQAGVLDGVDPKDICASMQEVAARVGAPHR